MKKIIRVLLILILIVVFFRCLNKGYLSYENLFKDSRPFQIMITKPFKNEVIYNEILDDDKSIQIQELLSNYTYEKENHRLYSSFRDGSEDLTVISITFVSIDSGIKSYSNYITFTNEHKQLIITIEDKKTVVFPVGIGTEHIFNKIIDIIELKC